MLKKIVLSIFIATGILSAQELSQLRLVGQPEKSAAEFVGSNIVDVNGHICAAIQVLSDLNGFSYDAYNQVVKVDDQPGRDMVYLQPEEQVLEILLSGYQPLKLILRENGIRLASREVWVIKIAGDKKITELPIAIITTPPGAEVFIDNNSSGTTEQHMVTIGQHQLRLVKPGYKTLDQVIQIDEKNMIFRYGLERVEDISLLIESTPTGATVYLDDKRVGITPFSTFYPPGHYQLRLEKDWYISYTVELDLAPPQKRFMIQLQENFAQLTVSSAPEVGLDIYLNGVPQQNRTPFLFERLMPGNYQVHAHNAFYETAPETITLTAGERKQLNLMSTASFAILNIKTRPGTMIYLNGKKLALLEHLELEPSLVTIRAELAKAPVLEKRVMLGKGETLTVEMIPIVPTGTIQVAVTPFDAFVELRGDAGEFFSATGAKIFTNVPVGHYEIRVSLKGYTEKQEPVILKEGEKITRSVNLESGNRMTDSSPQLQRQSMQQQTGNGNLVPIKDSSNYSVQTSSEQAMDMVSKKVARADQEIVDLKAELAERDRRISMLKATSSPKTTDSKEKNIKEGSESKEPDQSYLVRYNDARSLYEAKKYKEAISEFEKLVSDESQNRLTDNCQYWIGECYYGLRAYNQAIDEFRKVFSFKDSDRFDAVQLKLALCYIRIGNINQAKIELNLLISDYPNSEYVPKAQYYLDTL